MSLDLTKARLRDLLKVSDAGIADFFGITRSAVAQWPDDEPIPELRQLQVMKRRPELFGLRPVGQPAAHNGLDGGSAA